mmetsp:Transcript_105670/g.305522  ORF Transcript_105670/g.305522 Transcript_105670/m.305522 type:complete len:198 (+) Transcript_105670:853-1446(+)
MGSPGNAMRLDTGESEGGAEARGGEAAEANVQRKQGAAGGLVKDVWLEDDLWFGLLLHTIKHQQVHDRRFHDYPTRHLNPSPLSNHSLVVHRVQNLSEMMALEARQFAKLNHAAITEHARASGASGSGGGGDDEGMGSQLGTAGVPGAISIQIDDRVVWVDPPAADVHGSDSARSLWCAGYGLFDSANCELLASVFE